MEWLETSSFHQAWRAHTSRGYFRISFVHMARLLLQARVLTSLFCLFFAAMSSYLYIVKYELPIVIQSFVGNSNG